MSMTVGDLLRELEGLDENIEVRLAMQPSWPFEYSIHGAYLRPKALPLEDDVQVSAMPEHVRERYEERCENGEYADPTDPTQRDLFEPVLYLTEGSQLGYLPGVVKNNIW